MVQEGSSFLNILSRALAALLFRGVEPFMLFGRGHYVKYSCELILNLDQWFKGMSFKNRLRTRNGHTKDWCMTYEAQQKRADHNLWLRRAKTKESIITL